MSKLYDQFEILVVALKKLTNLDSGAQWPEPKINITEEVIMFLEGYYLGVTGSFGEKDYTSEEFENWYYNIYVPSYKGAEL